MLDELLSGLQDNCIGQIDDIMVASESAEEHLKIMEELFKRLENLGIMLNVEKTHLFQREITFMGYQVDAHGIAVKDFTLEKLRNAQPPTTLKELRSFNGLAEWIRPFAKSDVFSESMAILSGALTRKKDFHLEPREVEAFKTLCALELTKLVHPDWSSPFHLYTDASDNAIHSVLAQDHGIIAYAGRKLRGPELRKAIPEKELLSVVHAVTASHSEYLATNFFILHTDARALKYLMDTKFKNSKIFRWSILLSPYSFEIRHIAGKDNPADYGSRYVLMQEGADWYPDFYKNARAVLKQHELIQKGGELFIKFKSRVCKIPNPEERQGLLRGHTEDHIQAKPWYDLLSREYYYPKLYEDLRTVVRSCPTCQKMNPFPTGKRWFQNLPSGPNLELQVDHCGPFTDHDGDKFWILTCVDRFSGKLFATTVETTAISEVCVYLTEVVFHTFLPQRIHADRAFTNSDEFRDLCDAYRIAYIGGATSQSQGMVEVYNREIQRKLLRLGVDSQAYSQEGFQVLLTRTVLKHNTFPRIELQGLSPNEVLLGWRPEQPLDSKYVPDLHTLKETLEWRRELHHRLLEARKKTDIPEDGYHPGELILLKVKDTHKRAKNTVRNWGPYIVLENYGNGLLKIQYADGGTGDVSTKEVIRFHSNLKGGGDNRFSIKDASSLNKVDGDENKTVVDANNHASADPVDGLTTLDQLLVSGSLDSLNGVDAEWELDQSKRDVDVASEHHYGIGTMENSPSPQHPHSGQYFGYVALCTGR